MSKCSRSSSSGPPSSRHSTTVSGGRRGVGMDPARRHPRLVAPWMLFARAPARPEAGSERNARAPGHSAQGHTAAALCRGGRTGAAVMTLRDAEKLMTTCSRLASNRSITWRVGRCPSARATSRSLQRSVCLAHDPRAECGDRKVDDSAARRAGPGCALAARRTARRGAVGAQFWRLTGRTEQTRWRSSSRPCGRKNHGARPPEVVNSRATPRFWAAYRELPDEIRHPEGCRDRRARTPADRVWCRAVQWQA